MSIYTHQEIDFLRANANALREVQERLSLAQLVALITIAVEPGLSVNELGERLEIPQQTASRHVAALLGRYQIADSSDESIPLVVQLINEDDPRRRAIFLSNAGENLIKLILDANKRVS